MTSLPFPSRPVQPTRLPFRPLVAPPAKSDPGVLVPCPDCGAPLASYYDSVTGEEFYCERCAPACPECGKKMVNGGDPESPPVCQDCVFWGLADDGGLDLTPDPAELLRRNRLTLAAWYAKRRDEAIKAGDMVLACKMAGRARKMAEAADDGPDSAA